MSKTANSFKGYDNIFAIRLRILLKGTGTTQQILAEQTNCTRQAIAQYVGGLNAPNVDKLISIAKYFNVTVDYLLGLSDEPYSPTVKSEMQQYVEEITEVAVETYGVDSQLGMMIEECAELIQAINKYRRYGSEDSILKLKLELADVEIMLKQMEIIFGNYEHEVLYKINRLDRRLEEVSHGNHSEDN
ncbi:MAG: helix-turn-helix domain-containing protein [Ruminococcus sp.]|nr:helix-turn-helix domain-containing protein [Ruminococcus sp.]